MEKARKEAALRATQPSLTMSEYLEILLDTLQKRRGLGVQDGRDRVFAHLGIAESQEAVVSVDYTKTTREVYEEFALSCIKATNSYDILTYAERRGGPNREAFPSWCPDWGATVDRESLRGDSRYFGFQKHSYRGEYIYLKGNAATSVLAGASYRIGPLDRLSIEVTPLKVSKENYFMNSGRVLKIEGPRHDAECRLEEILDLELLDLLQLPRDTHRKHDRSDVKTEPYDLLIDLMFFLPITSEQSGNSSSFKRKLAIMRNEHGKEKVPALVPSATQTGDVIWWLSGSALPVVLRPCAFTEVPSQLNEEIQEGLGKLGLDTYTEVGHFEFIGECIVQGFMYATPREWRIFALH